MIAENRIHFMSHLAGADDAKINSLLIAAILSRRYPQNPLLTPEQFAAHLSERTTHVVADDLEKLDRARLFSPLVRVIHSSSPHNDEPPEEQENLDDWETIFLSSERAERSGAAEGISSEPRTQDEWQEAWDEGRITFRSPYDYEPWETVNAEGTRIVTHFYHPFQTFGFLEARSASLTTIDLLEHPFTPEAAWDTLLGLREHIEQVIRVRQNDAGWKKQLLLLLLVEDRFLPPIRESVTLLHDDRLEEEDWATWSTRFKPKSFLHKSGLVLEEVRTFRREMIDGARVHDPSQEWFRLVRHMPYDRRTRVRGETRLAWDYYEIAELLGDFIEDLTGERQRLPDDVPSTGAAGSESRSIPPDRIDYKRGNALPEIIRDLGLDPRDRVWIFVEGETEARFIRTWFGGYDISLPSSRIIVVNLQSYSGLTNPASLDRAREARRQQASVYVLVDDDGDRPKREADLRDWIGFGFISEYNVAPYSDEAITRAGGYIWAPCFEDHNFSFEEQVRAWRHLLETTYGPGSIDEAGFERAVEATTVEENGTNIGAIEKAARGHQGTLLAGGTATFSKADMGAALAELYRQSNRPICRILERIYQTAIPRSGIGSWRSVQADIKSATRLGSLDSTGAKE
jgi:hypothetical protein